MAHFISLKACRKIWGHCDLNNIVVKLIKRVTTGGCKMRLEATIIPDILYCLVMENLFSLGISQGILKIMAVATVNRRQACFNFLCAMILNIISKVLDCCLYVLFKAKIHKQSISHENLAKSHIHNQQTMQERLRQQKKVFLLCVDLVH